MSNFLAAQKQSSGLGQITEKKYVAKVYGQRGSSKASLKKYIQEHYCSNRYNGIENWGITLIDSGNTLKKLRRIELY